MISIWGKFCLIDWTLRDVHVQLPMCKNDHVRNDCGQTSKGTSTFFWDTHTIAAMLSDVRVEPNTDLRPFWVMSLQFFHPLCLTFSMWTRGKSFCKTPFQVRTGLQKVQKQSRNQNTQEVYLTTKQCPPCKEMPSLGFHFFLYRVDCYQGCCMVMVP